MNTEVAALLDTIRQDNAGADPTDAEQVLVAAAVVGPEQRRIAKALGRTRQDVAPTCRRARSAGIFVGARIAATDGWDNGVAFTLDCLVVDGLMERKLR